MISGQIKIIPKKNATVTCYRADYKDFLHVGSIYRRVAVDAGTIRRIFRRPSDNVGNYKKYIGTSDNQKGGINPFI